MAVANATATTSSLNRDAIYKQELAEYQAKTAKWAKIGAPPADQNDAVNRAQEAYPAPPKPKKKKKSCGQKIGGAFKKFAQVAVPAVVGFFTGGPAGAAMGAAKGLATATQKA
ncbi:MAG: hypothetical protein FJZ01_06200 [Candidatus Sericytochromatia bacterium]|nr:hypothetical protein [Candidatus Tanganyikabacteria bacterium]